DSYTLSLHDALPIWFIAPATFSALLKSAFEEPPSPIVHTATRGSLRILKASAAPAACRHCVPIGTHQAKSCAGPEKLLPRSSPRSEEHTSELQSREK